MPHLARIKSRLATLLAIVGVCGLLAHASIYVFRSSTGEPKQSAKSIEFPSPDGKFKAVLFSTNGGGVVDSYCYDTISIVPADATAIFSDTSARVYLVGCHSFSDPATNNKTNGPKLGWISNDHVQIHFSANQGARGVSELMLKGYGAHGKVFVSYVVEENSL